MEKECILGIDVGTSSCKTILLDKSGETVASSTREYPIFVPKAGWTEQNPEDWWKAVKESIKEIVERSGERKSIKAIGLTGQMHGLVALDKEGNILRPCILWNDQRCAPQCEEIYEKVGGKEKLLSYINNSMLPGYTAGKILWVKENEPRIYEKIAKVLVPKDYIRYRLTGEYATEVSDASGTGLFNVEERKWSDRLLEILEIPKEWMPECYESSEISGTVLDSITEELGLPSKLPVAGGGGDAVIQAVGAGIVSEEVALSVIGTSGVISVSLPHYYKNPEGKLQFFCNVMPDKWIAFGCTLNGGSALRWFRDTLGGLEVELSKNLNESAYDILTMEAKKSPPGSNGLVFLPYLAGERCPYTDPDAKGVFVGLGLNSKKCDIIRSVYEGVAFNLRDVLECVNQIGIFPEEIRASGGGAKSTFWRQIQADVFNKEVTTVRYSEEGAALAAAIVAGVGAGIWSRVEEATFLFPVETRTKPNPKNVEIYDKVFSVYRKIYPQLKSIFNELSSFPG
ncbi:xylulokinase [Candidatus Aerophobetes bacterium]|nr:xylulokinase [Candidatus Aerophobetes bacterium]